MFKKAVAAALISAMLASPLSALADDAVNTTQNSSQSQPAPVVQQTKAPEHKKALKKVLQKHKEALKSHDKVIQNREKALNNYKKAVEKHKEALKKHKGTKTKASKTL